MTPCADIHTHILPGMDDGSRSVEESLGMLREERRQGLSVVALTPHYYAEQNSPAVFLERRARAWQRLEPALEADFPALLLGAEVQYFEGIARVPEIEQLCIGQTGLLLLEMPFQKWTERVIREAAALHTDCGYEVVLAHVDRYFSWQSRDILERLAGLGLRMQLNADAFLHLRSRLKATALLKRGMVQYLGSDCHNLGKRPPNLEQAERWTAPYADRLLPVL